MDKAKSEKMSRVYIFGIIVLAVIVAAFVLYNFLPGGSSSNTVNGGVSTSPTSGAFNDTSLDLSQVNLSQVGNTTTLDFIIKSDSNDQKAIDRVVLTGEMETSEGIENTSITFGVLNNGSLYVMPSENLSFGQGLISGGGFPGSFNGSFNRSFDFNRTGSFPAGGFGPFNSSSSFFSNLSSVSIPARGEVKFSYIGVKLLPGGPTLSSFQNFSQKSGEVLLAGYKYKLTVLEPTDNDTEGMRATYVSLP